MSKTVRGEQIVIRISGPLRAELEQLADLDRRPLASLVRKVLVDFATQRVAERDCQEAEHEAVQA